MGGPQLPLQPTDLQGQGPERPLRDGLGAEHAVELPLLLHQTCTQPFRQLAHALEDLPGPEALLLGELQLLG